jgi:hydroxymethylpyrimidine pyrophosphatase-like HAD family hydrolase
MNCQDIIILDIDGTIDTDVLKDRSMRNQVLAYLRQAYTSGAKFYIVTARRLNEFKGNEHDLFTKYVPKDIYSFLYSVNKNRKDKWLYYNQNIDEPNRKVLKLLETYNSLIEPYENQPIKLTKTDDSELVNFNMGIHKMIQISEIVNKYPQNKRVIFFDDAKYNKEAWEFYYKYIDGNFKYLNFIGGNNRAVFNKQVLQNIMS